MLGFMAGGSKAEGGAIRTKLLRFNGGIERDPAVRTWMKEHAGKLGARERFVYCSYHW